MALTSTGGPFRYCGLLFYVFLVAFGFLVGIMFRVDGMTPLKIIDVREISDVHPPRILTALNDDHIWTTTTSTIDPPNITEANQPPVVSEKPAPNCSAEFMRNFYVHHHRYPEIIHWDDDLTLFRPDSCKLVQADVLQCLAKKDITSIAVYGDSQGWRYGKSIIQYFRNSGLVCEYQEFEKREGKIPDLDYLAKYTPELRSRMVAGAHQCRGCSGFRAKCTSGERAVTIEYISTEEINSEVVTLTADKDITAVTSFEEFLFNIYLKDRFPDLNVFFMPMNHIKRLPLNKFTNDFPKFLSILKNAIPPTSEFFLIPGTAEFDVIAPVRYRGKLFNGFLANDAIRRLNTAMSLILEPELVNQTSKLSSFLDLYEVTGSVLSLADDGVHFKAEWYQVFWRVFLDVYCQIT
ncbi:hypothetical protein CAPTEDRAFT_202528 [Capitella teleta]|uniref:SGNH domain-containing protein n=1 Tax=Capitella teleta TaxID=283909 RepID=R7V5N6_CAPTE|nr:hypothetical protein CAPTEDRAFT_202528 [Capitella teleta]|eukprot:ELU13884.1 hypothetical protein CAPTEDRAFT_202528 [Capitella teleta]